MCGRRCSSSGRGRPGQGSELYWLYHITDFAQQWLGLCGGCGVRRTLLMCVSGAGVGVLHGVGLGGVKMSDEV